jgi:hypothetical protein
MLDAEALAAREDFQAQLLRYRMVYHLQAGRPEVDCRQFVPAIRIGRGFAAGARLPFVFAAHFAPEYLRPAVQLYREQFGQAKYCRSPT